MFRNRSDAGRRLAAALQRFAPQRPIVLALPRGGVPVAFEIAVALAAPLEVIGVRKIGAPWQPELGVGAIVDGDRPHLLLDESALASLGLTQEDLCGTIARETEELARRDAAYRRGRPPVKVLGRLVIVVDDGIATGSTARAVVHALRERGASRVVIAAPVASPEAIRMLQNVADEVVCLEAPARFRAVGQFYDNFSPTTDEEVVRLLESC